MKKKPTSGKTIFLYFFIFFGLVFSVNSYFIYIALHTRTGTVTENAYEKGLAYNAILSSSKSQPHLKETATLANGKFQWKIDDEQGLPLSQAHAKVNFFRPIQEGSDFEMKLIETTPGLYQAQPNFPQKGLWEAQLDVAWNNKQYHTSQNIIVK